MIRTQYFKKDNRLVLELRSTTREKQVANLRAFRTKYLSYLIYGRQLKGKKRSPNNIWILTKHGYSESTVRKHADDETYYDISHSMDTYQEVCPGLKITPVSVTNCLANIAQSFETIREHKSDDEAKKGYELRDNYRLISMTLVFFYDIR